MSHVHVHVTSHCHQSASQNLTYCCDYLLFCDFLAPLLERPLLLVGVIDDVAAAHQQLRLHGLNLLGQRLLHVALALQYRLLLFSLLQQLLLLLTSHKAATAVHTHKRHHYRFMFLPSHGGN